MKEKGKMPMLSVVMPVFNGSVYLVDAISSILEQTYRDFEFVIINDGSTDNSLDIINEFSGKDSRIRVIDQENCGLPSALNRAIKESEGSLIARMDADDVSVPDRFEKQLALMNRNDFALVGAGICRINQAGSSDGVRLFPTEHSKIATVLPMRNCICHPSVIFRRDLFLEVGGYDVNYRNSQDYDLWLRLIDKGQFYNMKEPLLKYRRHDSRISAKSNKAKQTNYSVCAALNYFNRRTGLPKLMPSASASEVTSNIADLLAVVGDSYSRDCIVRHATRYARHCLTSLESRLELKRIALEKARLYQRLKWSIYEMTG